MNSDRRSLAGPILLAVLCLAFFSNALLLGGVFSYRDLLLFHYPLRNFWVTGLLSGNLPYLNPAINGGQPVLSNPNNSVFYPGNILYFLLDFDNAWNLALAGHAFWAGLGLYLLCRKLGCNRAASFSGGIVFGFGGPLLSCFTYYNLLITASWIPWVLAGCHDIVVSRKACWRALLPITCLLLAGEPTILLLTAVLLVALWTVLWRIEKPQLKEHLVLGLKISIPAILIFCIQLLPALLWLPQTARGEGLDFRMAAAYWSFHPYRLIEFVAPGFYGDVMSPYSSDYWGGLFSDGGYPYILKVYCGWLPLLLLPLALNRRAGRYAALLIATMLLLSFGHRLPGYRWLFDHAPLFPIIRYPEKFLVFVQLGLALTVALASNRQTAGRGTIVTVLAGSALIAFLLYQLVQSTGHALNAQQLFLLKRSLYSAVVAGVISTLVPYLSRLQKLKSLSFLLVPLVLTLDLLTNTFGIAATTHRAELHRQPVIVTSAKGLRQDALHHRGLEDETAFFSGDLDPELLLRESLYPLYGLLSGVSYGTAPDVDRMLWVPGEKRATAIKSAFPSEHFVVLSRTSGIGHILSLTPMAGIALQLEARSELPGRTVYLYRIVPEPRRFISWESGSGNLSWSEETPYSIQIHSRSMAPGKIKVLRNALPGWTARLDGTENAEIITSPEGWIFLNVGAGAHTIELEYSPPGLFAGSLLSILGIIAAVIISKTGRKAETSAPLVTAPGM